MKKTLSLSLAALALIAFVGTSASACGGSESCGAKASKTTNASDVKAECPKGNMEGCNKGDMEACAKKMGVSVEECMKMCSEKGSMTMHKISIQGMTCGNCEETVTSALEAVSGVNKVVSVSYKDGNAVVCVNKDKTNTETLTKAIADKGFKAEIIPAVAKTSAMSADGMKACSASKKAACASKDAPKDAKDTK